MPYTSPTEIMRQQALAQQLRSQPYERRGSTLSGLAHMLRQWGAGRGEAIAGDRELENQNLRRQDMANIAAALQAGNQVDPSTLQTPEAADMWTQFQIQQQLAQAKTDNTVPSNIKEWEYYSKLPKTEQEAYLTMRRSNPWQNMGGELVRFNQTDGQPAVVVPKTLAPADVPENAAEKAREVDQAQADVKIANAEVIADLDAEATKKKKLAELQAAYEQKMSNTTNAVPDIIAEARAVLTGKVKPTQSTVGTVVDAAAGLVGMSPEGAAEADQLRAIGGALVSKMPRMEGPQSDFDVKNYREMAGQVGDSSIPIKRRLKALEAVEKIWTKYSTQNEEEDLINKYLPQQ